MKDIVSNKKKKVLKSINPTNIKVVVAWDVAKIKDKKIFIRRYFEWARELWKGLLKFVYNFKIKTKSNIFNNGNWDRRDWFWIGLIAILVLLMTYPLVLNLTTEVPGIGNDNGDSFLFLWNVWWLKKVWLGQGDLFFTDYLFWPNGVSLVFHTFNIFNTSIIVLLSGIFGTVLSFNLVYLWSLWLAGVLMYVLVRKVWKSRPAGVVAATIFTFSPYIWAHSLGHFNLVTIWPFPALVLLIMYLYKKFRWWIGVLIGVLLSVIFYNDYQYFFYCLLLILILIIYYHIFDKTKKIIECFYIWLIAAFTSLLLVFPVFWRSWSVLRQFTPVALLSEVKFWSADLMSFVTPSWQHPVWGQASLELFKNNFASRTESVLFLGYGVIFLLIFSLILFLWGKKQKKYYLWLFIGLFFGILSLGPILKIYGQEEFVFNDIKYNIALPYIWLYKLPFWSIARVPARFFVVMLMSVAVLVAYAVAKLDYFSRKNVAWRMFFYLIFVIIISDVLVEYAALPLSLQKISIPPVYEQIKNDSRDVTVMELPIWWTSGHRSQGEVKTIIQYYQTFHNKKIFNGSVSRVPDALYDYYTRIPGVECLINVEDLPRCEDANRDTYWKWKNDLSVGYVIVHKKYYMQTQIESLKQYLGEKLELEKWYEDETEIGYKL